MKITLIGAEGFVGSAFQRRLQATTHEVIGVTRQNYATHAGTVSDVTIDAASNSRKFFAEEKPFEEFDASVGHRLRTLRDFPAEWHLHISSVDVYPALDTPEATREETAIDRAACSFYGLHKLLGEDLVRRHAKKWLILRLGGMVGPGMKKSPVFDLLHRRPLWLNPASRYQFIGTDDVARIAWDLVAAGVAGEIFNLCGRGTISIEEIARRAGWPMDLSQVPSQAKPRVVEASTEKISRRAAIPATEETITKFLETTAR